MGEQTKVRFELPDGPVAGETLWAEQVGDSLFRLLNTPYHAIGYAHGDVVQCVWRDGWFHVVGVERHSRNLTIRILFSKDFHEPEVQAVVSELASVGCSYEAPSQRLVAFDVPPDMEVPFTQMMNWLNGVGEDTIAGWEIAKAPDDLPH